jgi:hypothetical protein
MANKLNLKKGKEKKKTEIRGDGCSSAPSDGVVPFFPWFFFLFLFVCFLG